MKTLSIINPSRDNLKYLKWAYTSVRKNAPKDVEYCVASDFSSDGTVEWCEETAKKDPNFKFIVNDGSWFGENKGNPKRMGHTLLYDKLIEEVATNDIIMIWHSDMYLTPGSIENVLSVIRPGTVVSMTRIEPPLHPPGPEKIVADYGTEPEMFNEEKFLKSVEELRSQYSSLETQGMFAPWAIYKKDFLDIGGHDPLYAPQSREDSDIFNRFLLAGHEPIQLWNSFVYHMTCRGSRYNPKLTFVGQESHEWLEHNKKSERNFTRKWGAMVKVDEKLKPIVSHKYDISFVVKNCSAQLLNILEPWCTRIYCDLHNNDIISIYIKKEQPNTMYDLTKRIFPIQNNPLFPDGDIIVEFNGQSLSGEDFKDFIANLSLILDQGIEVGEEYNYGIFKLKINKIQYYEKELIYCDKAKTPR